MKLGLCLRRLRTPVFSLLTALILAPLSVQAAPPVYSASDSDDRVTRLEKQLQSRAELQADLVYQLEALREEVQRLRGQQEEHQYQIKQLVERQRELYRDIDRRLNQSSSSSSPSSSATTSSSSRTETPAASTATVVSGDEQADYEKIFPLVRDRKFEQAAAAYQAFLQKYPSSSFADNAHYWLGQVRYVQGQMDEALKHFKTVRDQFPQSTKLADAMLKIGQILERQGKTEEARAAFNRVINEHGGTHGQLARERLKALGN